MGSRPRWAFFGETHVEPGSPEEPAPWLWQSRDHDGNYARARIVAIDAGIDSIGTRPITMNGWPSCSSNS